MGDKILEISRLDFECHSCDEPAAFKVRTQPDNAITTRIRFYCKDHLPTSVRNWWVHEGGEAE